MTTQFKPEIRAFALSTSSSALTVRSSPAAKSIFLSHIVADFLHDDCVGTC